MNDLPDRDDTKFMAGLIREEDGRPLVLFHGGRVFERGQWYGAHRESAVALAETLVSDFSEEERREVLDAPHFFTDSELVASGYADQGEGYEVRRAAVSMQRPADLRLDALRQAQHVEITTDQTPPNLALARAIMGDQWSPGTMNHGWRDLSAAMGRQWATTADLLKAAGFDGLIFHDTCVRGRSQHTSYAVLDPNQIRHPDDECVRAIKPATQDMAFYIDCVSTPVKAVSLLNNMMSRAEEIDFETFCTYVDPDHLAAFAQENGYAGIRRSESSGLTLEGDHHVTYHRSRFAGADAAYIVHSAVEHVFLRPEDFYGANAAIDELSTGQGGDALSLDARASDAPKHGTRMKL